MQPIALSFHPHKTIKQHLWYPGLYYDVGVEVSLPPSLQSSLISNCVNHCQYSGAWERYIYIYIGYTYHLHNPDREDALVLACHSQSIYLYSSHPLRPCLPSAYGVSSYAMSSFSAQLGVWIPRYRTGKREHWGKRWQSLISGERRKSIAGKAVMLVLLSKIVCSTPEIGWGKFEVRRVPATPWWRNAFRVEAEKLFWCSLYSYIEIAFFFWDIVVLVVVVVVERSQLLYVSEALWQALWR